MELAVAQKSFLRIVPNGEERGLYSVITSYAMFDKMIGRHVCFAPTEAVIFSFKSSAANENDQSAL